MTTLLETPPPKEIPPNYVRRAMGLIGRRVIIPPNAQIMMYAIREYASNRVFDHQKGAFGRLREVNERVYFTLPEGLGK